MCRRRFTSPRRCGALCCSANESPSNGEKSVDLIIILIILLLLFGGGGGLYWGLGAGWGIGPIGLIIAVVVIAFLLNGYRGRRGPRI